MNEVPLISVLMPVYNTAEEFFRQSIESILNQTFEDFEFIIINDGSTNNVEDVVKSYCDKRIKYFKNETNLKLISTLNKGLGFSRGKYIARLDSDDYSDKTRFEKQLKCMEDNPSIGVLGTLSKRMPEEQLIITPTNPYDVMLYTRYCQNCIIHSSAMIKKSVLFDNNLRYDKNCLHAEDHKLWSDISRVADIAVYPEVLTHFRFLNTGVSSSNIYWQRKMVTVILLDNMIKDFVCDKTYLYSILVKYIKNIPVTEEEYNAISIHLIKVVNYVSLKVSEPYKKMVKNYILSILTCFIHEKK